MEENARIKERLQRKAAQAGVPISGTFELTPRCNLSCRMCYVRMSPEEMKPYGRELTAREWISLGEQATQSGMLFLLLTGGEPMLRPDFSEIYEAMSQMGPSISINTNGTMLSKQVRDLLERRPPSQLNVTLYGPKAATYDTLCGSSCAFEKTMDTLRWARDIGILLNVNITVTPWNMDQITELEALAERENLHLRMTFYNFPPSRRNTKTDFSRIAAEDVGRMIAQRECRLQGVESLTVRANSILKSVLSCPERQNSGISEGEGISCFAGRSQFWVAWNGEMTPCGMLDVPKTAPLSEGFQASWEKIKQETARIRLCSDCISCKERDTCFNCAAVMCTETGSFEGRPDYMCRLNHAYREEIILLAEKARSVGNGR